MATKMLVWLLVVLFPSTYSFADMYKWVDEEGNVNYGDSCPAAECEFQSIQTPPGPTDEQIRQSKKRMNSLIERTKRLEQSRKEKAERKQRKKEKKQKEMVELKRKCALYRQNLHVLQKPRPVYKIDHKGEYVFYNDVTRTEKIEHLKAFIGKHCD